MIEQNVDTTRQEALRMLMGNFVAQGHPAEYAQYMATAAIFQTDLELRNAQLIRLLSWLQQNHQALYPDVISLLEETRLEFERRVQQ